MHFSVMGETFREVGVPGLVAGDQGQHLLQQRVAGGIAHVAEHVERETLRHHLAESGPVTPDGPGQVACTE